MTGGSFQWALLVAVVLGAAVLGLVNRTIHYHRQPEGQHIPVEVEQ